MVLDRTLLALLIILVVAMLSALVYSGLNSPLPFEIPGKTNVIVLGAPSSADLGARGISQSDELSLPTRVTKFDLVTFDIPAISEKLKSGKRFPIRIWGKEYLVNVTSVNSEKSDSGIIRYFGKFDDEKGYRFLLTVGPDLILGTVIYENETFEIGRAEKNARTGYQSPLHFIYSSHDVVPLRPGEPWGLCGGEFEAYEFAENITPNGTRITLTEKDFVDFPELGAVIRGGKNTKATCSIHEKRYPFCIGGGTFRCEENRILSKYADPNPTSKTTIFGGGITKYVSYGGKSYYVQYTLLA
jgi:hypothetical protein